jgi:hypothetical protein
MKLQINVPVSGLDLASLLQGEEGFFLCQSRGQNYITVAKAGHSIAVGPTPIGRIIPEQPSVNLGAEPWYVTRSATQPSSRIFAAQAGARSDRRPRAKNSNEPKSSGERSLAGPFSVFKSVAAVYLFASA